MMQWLRLYHDAATDPKWRVISRRSGQPVVAVMALWMLMLVKASEATDRGTLGGWDDEDAAAALDMEPEQVIAIREAMQGKVLDGVRLSGWDRRQPKREREDNTATVSSGRFRRFGVRGSTVQSLRMTGTTWLNMRAAVFQRDGYACRYCGSSEGPLHCDHVIPVSRGGSNDMDNLATSCFRCNCSKGAKLLSEWKFSPAQTGGVQ